MQDALVEMVAKRLHDITNPDGWPADAEDRGGIHWMMGLSESYREEKRQQARDIMALLEPKRWGTTTLEFTPAPPATCIVYEPAED
jgi:hypothetical protein